MTSSGSAPANGNLSVFLKDHRQELIDRWSAGVRRENTADPLPHSELLDHIPYFIDELILALYPEALPLPSPGENAVEHGAQRLSLGFNVGEVVREYGTLHRCIIEIAAERNVAITPSEQLVIARWLDAGIANAVSQYVNDRDAELHRQASEHLGFIAHEVRNPLGSARMAFEVLRKRELAAGGRSVMLLDKTLRRTAEVVDNALNHAALSLGVEPRLETLHVRELFEEVVFDCGSEAQLKGIEVVVAVEADLTVEADVRLLRSALANLLHNALKFSQPSSSLRLHGSREGGMVRIEVEDTCGGLPAGRAEDLFQPLIQRGKDQTGFGLGLAIAQQATRAHNGTLSVRDLPGHGCVFTIELPSTPPSAR